MARSGIAIIVAVYLFLATASANAFVVFPRPAGYDRPARSTSFPAAYPGQPGPLTEGDRANFIKPFGGVVGINAVAAVAPVPEPATVALVGFGLAAIGMARGKFLK